MKHYKYLILGFFSLQILSAQTNESLPLSRFGIGSLSRSLSPISQGSGHAGLAYTNAEEYNPLNPASLGFLKITDVELGYNVKFKKISDSETSANDVSGTLSYLQIGVPLQNSINEILDHKAHKHNFGMSLGLTPFTSTSYNYSVIDSNSVGNIIRKLNGSGGLNQFQLGLGYRIKNFSTGINLGYIFGNLNYEQTFSLLNVYPSAIDNYQDRYYGSGVNTQLAFIYQQITNKKLISKDNVIKPKAINYSLLLGLPNQLRMSRYSVQTSTLDLGNVGEIVDTLFYVDNQKSKAELPFKVLAGISYNNKDKSGIMADFGYENWENVKKFVGEQGDLINASYVSLGVWYKPDNSGYGNVLQRSQYRFGTFYDQGYLSISNESLKTYGLTLGMGTSFNFQRQLCVVNLALEAGRSVLKNTIEENYIKLNIGIRINDSEWFLKRRYN
ncbi:MAG: hypothetical protein ABI851_10765 [Saprospiraceae bacterium]